jgi:hypothetical protein
MRFRYILEPGRLHVFAFKTLEKDGGTVFAHHVVDMGEILNQVLADVRRRGGNEVGFGFSFSGIVKSIAKTTGNVAAAVKLDHVLKPVELIKDVGELHKLALKPALEIVKAAGPVVPYVQSAISFVPGIGTGVSAGLGAAVVLSKGRPIDEAVLAAVKGSVPGGPVAQMVLSASYRMAKGQKVTDVMLATAREQLPPAAQKVFDVGIAFGKGKKLQDIAKAELAAAVKGKIAASGKLGAQLSTTMGGFLV